MPVIRPTSADRPEPRLGAPVVPPTSATPPTRSAAPPAGEVRGAGSPVRFPTEARRGERPAPAFTAGERLAVSSAMSADEEARGDGVASRPRFGMVRPILLAVLLVLAAIGAVTVYRVVASLLFG